MSSPDRYMLIDGVEAHTVDAGDRGLQFGDGVFETIKCIDGKACYWPQHMNRLAEGARRLNIDHPDETLLLADVRHMLSLSADCVIKIILTRGISDRGYAIPDDIKTTRIVRGSALPDYPASHRTTGIKSMICRHRLSNSTELAGIKHLNRLDNVMARNELVDGAVEGIMLDQQGRPVEGTMSNLFIVSQGVVITPILESAGIDGIIRQRLLTLAAQENIAVDVCHLTQQQLDDAEEILFCNSLIGIWPVAELAGRQLTVGSIARRMMDLLSADENRHQHVL